MASNKNIFCASNPSKLSDALWTLIQPDLDCLADFVIFLPSRRAVRTVEKMLVEKMGGAVLLPQLVPLGAGADDLDNDVDENSADIISTQERVAILAKLLTADPNIRTLSSALPIARDLVRMQDYLENEGIDSSVLDWPTLVDEKYAQHFQQKATFLDIVTRVLPTHTATQITTTKERNDAIRAWKNQLGGKKKVIVCGSTASVPSTADLMAFIADLPNGYILLSGKIAGRPDDFQIDTNPYNAEYKFLQRINVPPSDVVIINVGESDIDFLNAAFGNGGRGDCGASHARLIECAREAEEAEAVAEIASRAVAGNQTVLIITPDAAGNQRIGESLKRRGLSADFSGGITGTMTPVGRALLNLFDDWIENKMPLFDAEYKKNKFNLFETLCHFVDENHDLFIPHFEIDDAASLTAWDALSNMSDILIRNGIVLGLSDARAFIADALSGISIRPPMDGEPKICVLGTIESRMQTADVIILTGLNEGMFPARGYENSWLPKQMAQKIGLPPGDRKVSLMALDFMNLSCGTNVYWLRSKTAGSSQTTESRFLSRVSVAGGGHKVDDDTRDILLTVRARDNVPSVPLDYAAPRPPADRTDVYVTELESLIHNPYAFYVRHILRLYPKDDYWTQPDARDFGNLVHSVIETAPDTRAAALVAEMDARARALLPDNSILFHFWHKRFVEIAPFAEKMLNDSGTHAATEIKGSVNIVGRIVRAKADRIWDGYVLDIKTGGAPSKRQLDAGNMPQLPLEAFIMQSGGFEFAMSIKSQTPVLQFLQLQNNNAKLIEYDASATQKMIDAAVQKVSQLFGQYANDYEPYEYRDTSEQKYKIYDDLARVND